MVRNIQNKPITTRKRILIIGVILVVILILPLWLWSFKQTLHQISQKIKSRSQYPVQNQNLHTTSQELLASLKEFKALFQQIQAQIETPDLQTATVSNNLEFTAQKQNSLYLPTLQKSQTQP